MKKIGLVLSGGGSRGFAHFRVIKALNEAGITPNVVSGTSAGALCDIEIGVNVMSSEKNMPVSPVKDILKKCMMLSIGIQTSNKLDRLDF